MKKKLLALMMGTSLVLAACGGGDGNNAGKDSGNNETSTADGGDAARTYQNKCLSCHGQNLEGGVGPKLSDVGTRLSKEDIEKTIANGKGQMPGGLVKGDEAKQVAAWLSEKK